MAIPVHKYTILRLRESLSIPYRYPKACKELSVILGSYYSKSPKPLQSLIFDDTLFAFRLLPLMQTQSAVSAASLLIQSAESVLPKQKRALAASEFKQAKIAYKRRGKIQQDDKVQVNLPQDVLVHLFCFLDVQSLLSASLVCRSWNDAAGDNYLWQFLYTNYFDDSQSTSKFVELKDDETAVRKQHEVSVSSEVCGKVNQDWKVYFREKYLGSAYKYDRGYCTYCHSIVWLDNLKCPNQGQRENKHVFEPLSPYQIGKYIIEELRFPRFDDSEDDSYDSEEEEDDSYFSGIWYNPLVL